jgi:hypothetical protein
MLQGRGGGVTGSEPPNPKVGVDDFIISIIPNSQTFPNVHCHTATHCFQLILPSRGALTPSDEVGAADDARCPTARSLHSKLFKCTSYGQHFTIYPFTLPHNHTNHTPPNSHTHRTKLRFIVLHSHFSDPWTWSVIACALDYGRPASREYASPALPPGGRLSERHRPPTVGPSGRLPHHVQAAVCVLCMHYRLSDYAVLCL